MVTEGLTVDLRREKLGKIRIPCNYVSRILETDPEYHFRVTVLKDTQKKNLEKKKELKENLRPGTRL